MRIIIHTLFSGCFAIFFLCLMDCQAQKTTARITKASDVVSTVKQATVHFVSDLSEQDKDFIVKTLGGLENKIISCTSSPLNGLITINYSENIRERDILELLKMNGYESYLMKGEHIRVVLTDHGEAREELVK